MFQRFYVLYGLYVLLQEAGKRPVARATPNKNQGGSRGVRSPGRRGTAAGTVTSKTTLNL